MAQIGNRIRALREQRGLSQGDVERTTGMLRAYISRVEHGHTVPSLESIERFAGVLGVPLHEMFREVPQSGNAANMAKSEDPFLLLFTGYVHSLNAVDRGVLLSLANRLAHK